MHWLGRGIASNPKSGNWFGHMDRSIRREEASMHTEIPWIWSVYIKPQWLDWLALGMCSPPIQLISGRASIQAEAVHANAQSWPTNKQVRPYAGAGKRTTSHVEHWQFSFHLKQPLETNCSWFWTQHLQFIGISRMYQIHQHPNRWVFGIFQRSAALCKYLVRTRTGNNHSHFAWLRLWLTPRCNDRCAGPLPF